MGELLGILASFFFACAAIFVAKGQQFMSTEKGYFISLNVNVVISLGAYIILLAAGHATLLIDPRILLIFSIAGFFTGFLGRMLNYHCQGLIGVSKGSLMKLMSPLFAVGLGLFFLNEQVSVSDLFSIATILVGMLIVNVYATANRPAAEKGSIVSKVYVVGLMIGLSSALSYAIGNYFRKVAMNAWQDPVAGALVGVTVALLLFIIGRMLPDKIGVYYSSFKREGSGFFLMVGVCSILAQLSYFGSLLYLKLSIANAFAFLEPLFTIALAAVFLKNREVINMKLVLGAFVVVIGVVVLVLN